MNLAKAAIFLRDSAFPFGHIHHGLTASREAGGLNRQFTTVVVQGVFSHLYRHVTNTNIHNQARFRLRSLLSYISDLAFEYQYLNLGSMRYMGCKFSVVQYHGERTYRAVLAVNRTPAGQTSITRLLSRHFSEILLYPDFVLHVLQFTSFEAQSFMFWETKREYQGLPDKVPVPDIVRHVVEDLAGYISYIPFNAPTLFNLNLKIKTPREIYMNEMLSIYAVMFFLGSLVRYRPEILEGMLEKRDAWMIETFIRNTPTTFLAHMRNFMDGNYLAYEAR
jgi:hypothetical protein